MSNSDNNRDMLYAWVKDNRPDSIHAGTRYSDEMARIVATLCLDYNAVQVVLASIIGCSPATVSKWVKVERDYRDSLTSGVLSEKDKIIQAVDDAEHKIRLEYNGTIAKLSKEINCCYDLLKQHKIDKKEMVINHKREIDRLNEDLSDSVDYYNDIKEDLSIAEEKITTLAKENSKISMNLHQYRNSNNSLVLKLSDEVAEGAALKKTIENLGVLMKQDKDAIKYNRDRYDELSLLSTARGDEINRLREVNGKLYDALTDKTPDWMPDKYVEGKEKIKNQTNQINNLSKVLIKTKQELSISKVEVNRLNHVMDSVMKALGV